MLNTNKKQNQSNLIGTPQTPALLGLRDFPQKGLDAYLIDVLMIKINWTVEINEY